MKVTKLDVKRDDRGMLVEVFKPDYIGSGQMKGQFFVTTANPGKIKGKHYHTRKVEWFCVVRGQGDLHIEDVRTGEKSVIEMGENNMVTVEISPYNYHYLENTGDEELLLLVYVSEQFDPKDADTYARNESP